MSTGIKDKVAILGMGCSRFGERWDCSTEDLALEVLLGIHRAGADAIITYHAREAARALRKIR